MTFATAQVPFAQARQYLSRVVPWPQEGEAPAWVNVHWTFVPKDKPLKPGDKLPWTGRAVKSLNDALFWLGIATKNPDNRDVYLCLSSQMQAQEKVSAKGKVYYAPIRLQSNAMALKSLFIDIDVKEKKGYPDFTSAVTALGQFIRDTGLPNPTMVVASGGGMHVYWCLMRALTPHEWTPLAYALAEATRRHGLKCDTECTIDAARVLRVPDTLNHKEAQARPVRIVGKVIEYDYDNARLEKALEPYQVPVPVDTMPLPPRAPLAGESDLSAGIDMNRAAPVKVDTIAPECGFVRDALATGGKDYSNPLWNLTTLLATFCENGRQEAHRMACGHPGYTQESTDELYDRKEQEKLQRNLGWPSCAGISGSGATQCATCPHFNQGKSPLNFGERAGQPPQGPQPQLVQAPGGGTVTIGAPAAAAQAFNDMPAEYSRRGDGVILLAVTRDDGTTGYVPVTSYPMTDPWMQSDPWMLHFSTIVQSGRAKTIDLELEVIGTNEMRKSLGRQGFMYDPDDHKKLTRFLVSWIKQLQQHKDAVVSSSPFGWNTSHGKLEGFVFGGNVWKPNGSRPAASPDPVTARQYQPTGEMQPWRDASAMITSQGRPELDAIIASAFAAPLVRFTGQSGLLMSAYSLESGIGKSTTLKVAQAVWGDPIKAVQSLSDTQNAVINKIGELRSLPLYWDELKTEDDTRRFVNLVFQLSGGKEKSRMTSRVTQRDIGTWQTMMVSASNDSLLDYVASRTRMTTAGIYRVFEYDVPPGQAGQISPADAQRIIAKLNDNYGVVGVEYAKWLGTNFVQIDKEVGDALKTIGTNLGGHADERFWIALIVVLMMGARYGNHLGFTQIDEKRLYDFLVTVLGKMRDERNRQPVDMKDAMNVSNILASFLNANRSRHTIFTNRIHISPGKPAPNSIVPRCDTTRLDGIYVHIGMDDKLMRISSQWLSEWLSEKGLSRHSFTKALTDEMGMRPVRGRIASGTEYAGATEYLLEINLAGTPLANFIDEA